MAGAEQYSGVYFAAQSGDVSIEPARVKDAGGKVLVPKTLKTDDIVTERITKPGHWQLIGFQPIGQRNARPEIVQTFDCALNV